MQPGRYADFNTQEQICMQLTLRAFFWRMLRVTSESEAC